MNYNPSAYLELMKVVLTDYYPSNKIEFYSLSKLRQTWKIKILNQLDRLLSNWNFTVNKTKTVLPETRANGYDWPANAYTMIGINRLTNIEFCIRSIVKRNIQGDLVEAGIWRGGSVIFMKAVLNELAVYDRKILAADSYNGLPKPDKNYPADIKNILYRENILAVSLEDVKNNFRRFGLLDSSIIFLEGLFKNTLQNVPIDKISLLRLDCDMYESTIIALSNLYPKLSEGGFIIIDDYNSFNECKIAVDDFRKQLGIVETIIEIDKEAIYWQKNTKTNGN
ncbi:MAG: macrocin O-methyltransferase [Cytophagales bacterium]|nr:MAG: macrocin O-methyltransferase [Cytophagales bacterium]